MLVKMVPTAGVHEFKMIGAVIAACGVLVFFLAIPTTCMLPYPTYTVLHAHNFILPLGLVYTGISALGTGIAVQRANGIDPLAHDPPDRIRNGLTIKRLIPLMAVAIAFIMEGSGELIYGYNDGTFLQVVKQIRTGKWGDLNPTGGQIQALGWMYEMINVTYVVARMALVLGFVLTAAIWINRANAAETGKPKDEAVEAGKSGEHVKMLTA